jgi:hypothetical protein
VPRGQYTRIDWSPREERTIDRYARALADGSYRTVAVAAQGCLHDLRRHRRGKSRAALQESAHLRIRNLLSHRAKQLGWDWFTTRWRADEREILERHVRAQTRPGHTSLCREARACWLELEQLHRRIAIGDPNWRNSFRSRTPATIRTYLGRLTLKAGRTPRGPSWYPSEIDVIRRHARILLAGKYLDAHAAAAACQGELSKLRHRLVRQDPTLARTAPRTHVAVYEQLRRYAHGFNRRWPKTRWTDAEMKLCRQWIRWYERYRGVRRLRPWETLASGLQEELERLNSRRTLSACRARFWKEWKRQHGLALPHGRSGRDDADDSRQLAANSLRPG